ncbi:MAG: cobalt-precorrin-5B (C(1))-methyltransferase CbiD [Planctomycetes bacterium]|nr:cobalt-precorrin-5B (C(1))-methyltransferase CbiD [Planctomycetota bacterium]
MPFPLVEKAFFVSLNLAIAGRSRSMRAERYVFKNGRKLRYGITTGSCAAMAAGAATELLLGGRAPRKYRLLTPAGMTVIADIVEQRLDGETACCAVRKDAGDDPDATDGILVRARVGRSGGDAIVVDGGEGVGRVTKPGLEQPVGAAAINSVPRRMIEKEVRQVCRRHGYDHGLEVEISVPGGETVAGKTFNPNLGILGGISIIGTTGVVEPMSNQAILDTIGLELSQRRAEGRQRIIIVPGNYGADFVAAKTGLAQTPVVKCSNFIGEALDLAGAENFAEVLLVGHVGKMIKLAGGVMDTHSRVADCRLELLALHTALVGGETGLVRAVAEANTVEDGLDLLEPRGMLQPVCVSLAERVDYYLKRRVRDAFAIGAVLFSNRRGILGTTPNAETMMRRWESLHG